MILIIIVSYRLTSLIYAIRYDFGIPSLLVILMIYMLDGFNLETVRTYKRSCGFDLRADRGAVPGSDPSVFPPTGSGVGLFPQISNCLRSISTGTTC